MDANPVLLAAFARLLTLQTLPAKEYPLTNILKWGEYVTLQPPEHRVVFITMLAETNALHVNPMTLSPSITQAIGELYAQPFWQYRLYALLRAFGLGLDCEYFIAGFAFANVCDEDYLFHEVVQCGAVPVEDIKRLDQHLCKSQEWEPMWVAVWASGELWLTLPSPICSISTSRRFMREIAQGKSLRVN